MARGARRRKPQVISDGGVFVALFTLNDGVRAEKRKPVKVLLNRLDRHPPPQNGMALSAIGAELGSVNVRMTIGAILAHIGEHRFGMASRAGHFFVHAPKRVLRGVMVEFRDGANGSPAGVCVAILARNVQGTVRTPTRLSLCGRRAGCPKDKKSEDEKTAELEHSVNDCPQMRYRVPTLSQNRA